MFKKIIQVALLLIIVFSANGCGTSQKDYPDAREAAWNFLVEKGWDEGVRQGSRQDAEVRKVTIDNDYFLLDKNYEGEEALSISFEEKESLVAGVPLVLVSLNTIEVIGYMPSE